MATRTTYNGADDPDGPDLMDNVAGHIGVLYDSIALRPVTITNSGNDYTITVDPTLDADVVSPMGFYVRPNVDNTGPVRIRVTSANPYYDAVRADGSAFGSGSFLASTDYFFVFLTGKFVCLSDDNQSNTTADPAQFVFTSSGTLDLTLYKENSADDRLVMLEGWAGGGGGGEDSGGGGGGYKWRFVRIADLPDILSYTVGAGGTGNASGNGTAGGTTSIGSFLSVTGGGPGRNEVANTPGGDGGGYGGGLGAYYDGSGAVPAQSSTTEGGGSGGGGGGGIGAGAIDGADALKGGAGGGGWSAGVGGISDLGGAGGNAGVAGSVPGGGGVGVPGP